MLGEEPAGGDGAICRFFGRAFAGEGQGMTDSRHVVTCNGRKLPLHPTGVQGEYVAGVRYRAWQPPSCLHPTIPVDTPLVVRPGRHVAEAFAGRLHRTMSVIRAG